MEKKKAEQHIRKETSCVMAWWARLDRDRAHTVGGPEFGGRPKVDAATANPEFKPDLLVNLQLIIQHARCAHQCHSHDSCPGQDTTVNSALFAALLET